MLHTTQQTDLDRLDLYLTIRCRRRRHRRCRCCCRNRWLSGERISAR